MERMECPKLHFVHSQLGELIGYVRDSNVVQFRGVPYATIPGRYRQSLLRTDLPNQPFDATQPGPICPQKGHSYWPFWDAPLPDRWPRLNEPTFDEFECLNLSLSIPKTAIDNPSKKLPVYVFIHGGGLNSGSHAVQLSNREVFDSTGLVQHSIRKGQEMIVVAINYRLTTLGFLASKQLVQYNRLHNEPLGNYGLHDQRRAFDWISKFISGFGGDPSAVTIQGTSAGSLSCHFQTLFPDRKFKRAILASGTFNTVASDTLEQSQRSFDLLVDAIRPGTSAEMALDVLLTCDAEQIANKAPELFGSPWIDGEYILGTALQDYLRNDDLPDIMIGAASEEDDLGVAVLKGVATNVPHPDEKILETLPLLFNNSMVPLSESFPFNHPGVIEAYGLGPTLSTPSQDLDRWGSLAAHYIFNVSTLHTAVSLRDAARGGRIWLYQFAVTCPYPAGHAPNKAHHGINDLVLFNNGADQVPQKLREAWDAAVEQTQSSWIDFANGGSPWDPLRPKVTPETVRDMGPVFVFADGQESRVYDRLEDALGKDLMDKWAAVLQYCNS